MQVAAQAAASEAPVAESVTAPRRLAAQPWVPEGVEAPKISAAEAQKYIEIRHTHGKI